jgi:4-hydroxymandelate oxidase
MNLDELEASARELLPRDVYDYIAGGSFDELTLADNRASWDRLRMRPRVLRDVRTVSARTAVLGTEVAHPLGVAPTAFHKLCHGEGEVATAGGAADTGSLFVLSTRFTVPIEDVAAVCAEAGSPWWFQVYVLRDRELTRSFVERAMDAGARALVLTGDTPMMGRRLRDAENRFPIPTGVGVVESLDRPDGLGEQDAGATFDDVAWLADLSGLPVVVKGVLRADDAVRCLEAGAAAVWVSNHGGRQLDGAVAGIDALPEVVDAIGARAEVYVDGGVRRGTDVLKGLALGAQAVFVGRPIAWGLAVDGRLGVKRVLRGLVGELELAMALAGARSIDEVTPDLIAR